MFNCEKTKTHKVCTCNTKTAIVISRHKQEGTNLHLSNESKMKPSEICKEAGLKSLEELSSISGESVQTLINWHRNKLFRFHAILEKALRTKHDVWQATQPPGPDWYWVRRVDSGGVMWVQLFMPSDTLADGFEWRNVERPSN